ncbi:hypothetical protein [Calothrix sp. NIES-2098]|uniref:hypothetical protein n=1 Tax=Calothrix sp. NIES-2098 TaxID=1954171 RepID=UPI000B61C26E|nr:hypothetical protein NIES2098_06130 [Calothrix sp. NIES-2098]
MCFVGVHQKSATELIKLLEKLSTPDSCYFLRWTNRVSGFWRRRSEIESLKEDICDRLLNHPSQQFPSPEGQLFNHHLELRWKKQGELYKVLLLTTLKLEPGFEPVGENWEVLDRNAHQYSATDSRFPQGFTSDDVKIAQRYFRDSTTATVHFVALTIPK